MPRSSRIDGRSSVDTRRSLDQGLRDPGNQLLQRLARLAGGSRGQQLARVVQRQLDQAQRLPQSIVKVLRDAPPLVQKYRLDLIGLHMHIGSGTDFEHLKQVCEAMVEQVRAIGVDVRAISGGGGMPIRYRECERPFDTAALHALWNAARARVARLVGHDVSLEIEPGRYLVGESGVLVAEIRAVKRTGSNPFLLVDAGFNDLMRPAMYGAHHEIALLPADDSVRSVRPPPWARNTIMMMDRIALVMTLGRTQPISMREQNSQ